MFTRTLRPRIYTFASVSKPRLVTVRCLTAAATAATLPAASKPRGFLKFFTLSGVGIIGTGAGYSYYQRFSGERDTRQTQTDNTVSSDAELLALLRASFIHGGPEDFDALCDIHPTEMDQIISEFVYTASQLEQLGRLHEPDALDPYYERFHDKAIPLLLANDKILSAVDGFEKELLTFAGGAEEMKIAQQTMEKLKETGVMTGNRKPTAVRDALFILGEGTKNLKDVKRTAEKKTPSRFRRKESRLQAMEDTLRIWRERIDLELPKRNGDKGPDGD
ncbi:hypothetical protein BDD12DRAFT_880544 [Trichophaea hybrida]|nr:hypothetical protein BDD12DRAFT_880544 [Trichophaea hybrida]